MKEQLLKYGEVLCNESLKKYNTFKIGGECKYFLIPKTGDDIRNALVYLQEKQEKYFILGNGSNIIFADSFFDGVIISLKKLNYIQFQDSRVLCGAGVMMPFLALQTISHGFSGFEWAAGIPGTVGGSIYGNAEAYKESTFDRLVSVKVITPYLEIKILNKEELSYGYRTSFFKENPGYVILEAVFNLLEGNSVLSEEIISRRQEKRKATQPLEYPSAGSVFRNPSLDNPSGRIIESLGFKGVTCGDAMISPKHANFIINMGNATGKDVRNLIELVHKEVKEKLDIDLVMEQEFVGWD